MNAPLDHSFLNRATAEEEFAVARSRCIDAFAQLELRAAFAAKRVGLPVNRDCLGRRVAAFANAVPGSALSKADAPKLHDWVVVTEPLIARRAWLVHAEMELGDFNGRWKAIFANVVDVVKDSPIVLLVGLEELCELRRAVCEQSRQLANLVKGVPAIAA